MRTSQMAHLVWLSMQAAIPVHLQEHVGSAAAHKLLVGVVVDVRHQQASVIEFERQAVSSLSNAFEGLSAEAFVVIYSDRVQQLSDVSAAGTGLSNAQSRIIADGG